MINETKIETAENTEIAENTHSAFSTIRAVKHGRSNVIR
jgi:hypothetical protein